MLCLLAAFVLGRTGFGGDLSHDKAVYAYAGQRMVEGEAPYKSIFDVKTPGGYFMCCAGVSLARKYGIDDLLGIRVFHLFLACLAIPCMFWLGREVGGLWVGLFSALLFLCFVPWCLDAGGGPQPKAPMVLFSILALLYTMRRRWLAAGFFGSLAFIIWQPMLIYPALTLGIGWFAATGQRERWRQVALVVAGSCLAWMPVLFYFWWHNALGRMVDESVIFLIQLSDRTGHSSDVTLFKIVRMFVRFYDLAAIAMVIGFVVVAALTVGLVSRNRSLTKICRSPLAVIVLTYPFPFIWSLMDFQGPSDLYVLLPYAALGFGIFLKRALFETFSREEDAAESLSLPARSGVWMASGICLGLIGLAYMNMRYRPGEGLRQQREGIAKIEMKYGKKARYLTVGDPQFMVLTRRVNPNPYLFVIMGIDNYIEAREPGGFQGWLDGIEKYNPDVIVSSRFLGSSAKRWYDWLGKRYRREKIGVWTIYVRSKSG